MADKLRVRFDIAGGNLRPRYLNDRELSEWQQGPPMAEYLRQMSEQGWRMTTLLEGQEYLFETSNGHRQEGARTNGSFRQARRERLEAESAPAQDE